MGLRKSVTNYGHSLMELILATAIVGTISALAIPNYARYIASTREKVCSINRQEVLYEYQLYCLSEQEIPLSDYLLITYEGRHLPFCPSGGLPTTEGTGETAELACSIHPQAITLLEQGTIASADLPLPDSISSEDLTRILKLLGN